MTWGFDSDNVVFVPEGARLSICDVYAWRRIAIDVRRSTVRMRPEAIAHLEAEAERVVQALEKRKETTREAVVEARVAVRRFVADVKGNQASRIKAARSIDPPGGADMRWWVRLTDGPAESFFAEDYEETDDPPTNGSFVRAFGSCVVSAGEAVDIPFPAEGDAGAFEWILPLEGAVVDAPLPVDEPLPLIHEFCGTAGVSSRGNSVNITVRGEIAPTHTGCCPLRVVGEGAMATLYFSRMTAAKHRILNVAGPLALERVRGSMAKSGFEEAVRGPNWTIVRRGGDVVHLYTDLEGKESSGFDRIPGLILVACANGGFDGASREKLLRSIVGSIS